MKDMWIIHFIFIYFKVMYNIYYHNIWVPHSLCCYLHISLVRSYYFHCTAEQSNQPATQGGFTLLLCHLQHLSQTLSPCEECLYSGGNVRSCQKVPERYLTFINIQEDSKCYELDEMKVNLWDLPTIWQDAWSRLWKHAASSFHITDLAASASCFLRKVYVVL